MKKVYRIELDNKCYHVGMGEITRTKPVREALELKFPSSNHTKAFMFFCLKKLSEKGNEFKIIETEAIYTKEEAEALEISWKNDYGYETCGTIGQELVTKLIKDENISDTTELILRSWGKNGDSFCKGRTYVELIKGDTKKELNKVLGNIFK